MTESVSKFLQVAAVRLLLARMAEAGAAAATAAGGVSLALMTAWILAGPYPLAATLLALAPLPAGAVLLLGRRPVASGHRWRRLWHVPRRLRWPIVIMVAAASAAACAGVHSGRVASVPHWLIPIVLVPLGTLPAVGTVLARGVSRREAALYLDVHASLGERLTTAIELTAHADDAGFARAVEQQAAETARDCQPLPRAFWRRRHVPSGAAVLLLLACAALALTTPLTPPGSADGRRWAGVVMGAAQDTGEGALTEPGRAVVAEAPQVRAEGHLLGRTAEGNGRRQISPGHVPGRVAGKDPAEEVPDTFVRKNGRAETATGTFAPGKSAEDLLVVSVFGTGPAGVGNGGRSGASTAAAGGEVSVTLEEAWAGARRRAAESLVGRDIPARHRSLIRGYYGNQD